ncbi:MAG: hypothetical protein V1798_04150 [Pseudomonadota bacterium]
MTKKHALYLSLPLAALLASPLLAEEAKKAVEPGMNPATTTTEVQPVEKKATKHWKHSKKTAKAEEKKAEEKKAEETKKTVETINPATTAPVAPAQK